MRTSSNAGAGPPLIAIDGLGAVGKSTVGPIVARTLGYRFVDSGDLYRALTWLALHRGIDTGDEPGLTRLAAETRLDIGPSQVGDSRSVFVDRLDVTAQIHTRQVDAQVGHVSRLAGVRQCLVLHQRDLARDGRLVMAGRDIGTVVLPQARLKVFLVASPEERARRRHLERQLLAPVTYEEVLAEMKKRDAIDTTRDLSPTVPAGDARIVDTEGLTPRDVADRILAMAKEAI